MKESPHRATDDFGVPEVNGSRQADRYGRSQGGRGAHDGADVPWILNGVQNDDANGYPVIEGDRREVSVGYFRDREQALWAIGVGGGGEFRGGYLLHRNPTVVEGGHELTGSWKLGVRDRERGPNHQR